MKAYRKYWRESPEGKAYKESPEGKAYHKSPEYKAYQKAWKGSPEGKAVVKAWRESPEGRAAIHRGLNKRRRNGKFVVNDLTASEWEEILQEQNHECLHLYDGCKGKFNEYNKPTKDHIIPESKGGGLTKNNVQALCKSCNSWKLNKTNSDYIKHFSKNVRVMLGIR